jgi:hypothetical protein
MTQELRRLAVPFRYAAANSATDAMESFCLPNRVQQKDMLIFRETINENTDDLS